MDLQTLIDNSQRIVFFGGAGVSTESGVPDFRGVDGLYRQKYKYPPEVILSHDFFFSNTAEFYEFYREKLLLTGILPNPAHIKLAGLEASGKLTAVITQNIDGLHRLAGSKQVYELHGTVLRNYCVDCHRYYDDTYIRATDGIPRCSCGGIVKPDVVLYGEPLNDDTVDGAIRAISSADLCIVGGTSLTVYPAAGLIRYFTGNNLVLINQSPTYADSYASLVIREPIGRVFDSLTI